MKRLYLQYQPKGVTPKQMEELQLLTKTANNNLSLIDAEQIHLTLIHFGILEQVYKELLLVVPKLSWQDFVFAVNRFAEAAQAHLPETITATVDRLALYGHGASVLVAELSVEPDVRAAQQACARELAILLESLCVVDSLDFMQTNHNFRHAFDFRPHISLARNVQTVPELPAQQEKLHLELVPLGYDLRNGRSTRNPADPCPKAERSSRAGNIQIHCVHNVARLPGGE